MLIKNLWVHRNLALIIVVVYALLLAVLSLAPIDGEVPHFGFSFDDKIYHLAAHFVLTVLLYMYVSKIRGSNIILFVFFMSVVYGIIIEVLQEFASNPFKPENYFFCLWLKIISTSIFQAHPRAWLSTLQTLLLHYHLTSRVCLLCLFYKQKCNWY